MVGIVIGQGSDFYTSEDSRMVRHCHREEHIFCPKEQGAVVAGVV